MSWGKVSLGLECTLGMASIWRKGEYTIINDHLLSLTLLPSTNTKGSVDLMITAISVAGNLRTSNGIFPSSSVRVRSYSRVVPMCTMGSTSSTTSPSLPVATSMLDGCDRKSEDKGEGDKYGFESWEEKERGMESVVKMKWRWPLRWDDKGEWDRWRRERYKQTIAWEVKSTNQITKSNNYYSRFSEDV